MSSPGYAYTEDVDAATPNQSVDSGDTSWWDYPEQLRAATSGLGSGVASLIQDITQNNPELATNAEQWRRFFTADEQNAIAAQTPEAQAEINAAITSPEFWRHPVRAGILQSIGMAPMVAAAAGAAMLAPEGAAALGAGALAGGGLNVGLSIDDTYKLIDNKSDADLQKENKYYAMLRHNGMDERSARADLVDKMQGISPIVNFATGAGAMLVGPVGKFFGLPLGTAGAGLARRMAVGAAEAGAGMASQSAALEYASQYAQSQLDPKKQFDSTAIATAALQGAVGGAFLGAATGVLPHPVRGAEREGRTEAPVTGPTLEQEAATGAPSDKEPPDGGGGAAAVVEPAVADKGPEQSIVGTTTGGGTQTASMPQVSADEARGAQAATVGGSEAAAQLPETAAAVASGQTVPESRAALHAQVEQLANRNRAVVVFPKGTKASDLPPVPAGMKRVSGGMKDVATIYYDPDRISGLDIRKAVREGRINELIGIGPYSKEEIAARVQAGEPAVGVVGRDAEGNEVQSAVGTPSTAPEQAAAISRDPNLTVGIEHPADTLGARVADRAAEGGTAETAEKAPAAPAKVEPAARPVREKAAEKPAEKVTPEGKKVLRAPIDPAVKARIEAAENARVAAKKEADALDQAKKARDAGREAEAHAIERAVSEGQDVDKVTAELKAGKGAKKSAEQKARRAQSNESAKKVTDAHPPADAERSYRRPGKGGEAARRSILERARAMVKAADEAGVEKPTKIRAAEDPAYGHNASVILLDEARRLLKAADETKSGMPGVAKFDHFLAREAELRGAKLADVNRIIKERSAEGETKKRPAPKTETEEAATERVQDVTTESPEEALARKQEAEAEGETTEGEAAAEAAGGREREPVKLTGKEVTAVEDKTGTFKTETKRKRYRSMNPSGAAGGKVFEGLTKGDFIAEIKRIARVARNKQIFTVKDVLRGLRAADLKKEPYLAKLDPYLKAKIIRIAGKVPIRFISKEEMLHANGGDEKMSGFYSNPGYYKDLDPDLRAINGVVRDGVFIRNDLSPEETRHTIMHETLHAATTQAMRDHPEMQKTIQKLMDELKQAMVADPLRDWGTLEDISRDHYAFTDPFEFIAEAMSNPDFQKVLATYEVSPELAKETGLTGTGKFMSYARAILSSIREYVFGKDAPDNVQTALESAFQLTDNLFNRAELDQIRQADERGDIAYMGEGLDKRYAGMQGLRLANSPQGSDANKIGTVAANIDKGEAGIKKIIHAVTDPVAATNAAMSVARSTGDNARWALHNLQTFQQLTDANKDKIPMGPEISRTNDKIATQAMHNQEDGNEILAEMASFVRNNPALADDVGALLNDQTMYGVDAKSQLGEGRNAHLETSKEYKAKEAKGRTDIEHTTAMDQWAARQAHPDLQERYNRIVKAHPEYAKLQDKLFDYFRDTQKEMMHEHIDTIMRGYDFKGTDAERAKIRDTLYEGNVDQELRDLMEKTMGKSAAKQLADATHLRIRKGPYKPLMRHGDHAVVGRYKITDTGKSIAHPDENTWEFKTRKDAFDFVKANKDLFSRADTAYYDPKTGERVTKLDESKTASPEKRFQVRVQGDHLEFHETAEEARAAKKELMETGRFEKLASEERRRNEYTTDQFTHAGTQALIKSLEQTEAWQNATKAQKETLRNTVIETGLRANSDNRVQARRLPRRNVKGASTDFLRDLHVYNISQASFRAKMKYRAQIDKLMDDMEKHVTAKRYEEGNEGRREIANEIQRRVTAQNPDETSGAWTKFTRKMMMYSYVSTMARGSHLILHQSHWPMITSTVIAGRHGLFKTYNEMMRTWRTLSGGYVAGGKDFRAALTNAMHKGTDYGDLFKQRLAKEPDGARLGRMIDALSEEGTIHPSSQYEFSKYLPHEASRGRVFGPMDRVVERVDTVFRHATNATEAINRIGGAVQAFRLEYDKATRMGKSPKDAEAEALDYARDIINKTQGKFTPANAAPIFKNKWLRPFLQFKQFPQMMYHLIGDLAVRSLKGETRDIRVEAMKSLALLLGAHVAMAGVLQGLPLEPLKMLAWVSKQIGLTKGDWSDVEDSVRQNLIDTFGKTTADIMTNGLGATLFGVDVHHRMGLNSFFTYGLPDQVDDAKNAEFILSVIAGAPGGLAANIYHGAKGMLTAKNNDDLMKSGLQLLPSQQLRDIQQAIFGGEKASGYVPDNVDRFKRLIGFTPAADAEAARRENAVFRAVSEYNTERKDLIKEWATAAPADRAALWEEIQEFNEQYPRSARITREALVKAMHGQKKAIKVAGVRVTNVTKQLAEQAAGRY